MVVDGGGGQALRGRASRQEGGGPRPRLGSVLQQGGGEGGEESVWRRRADGRAERVTVLGLFIGGG